jgi:hypothetical protein
MCPPVRAHTQVRPYKRKSICRVRTAHRPAKQSFATHWRYPAGTGKREELTVGLALSAMSWCAVRTLHDWGTAVPFLFLLKQK